ncbi:MAG: shikimate dehydrogenase [Nitrososphaerales archaeon]
MNLRHELVAAFGDPIDENPTGVMMEPAFAAAGLQWRYQLLHIPRQDLAAAVAAVRVLGFRGFNCTIPHKTAVLQHLDAVAPDAALMGAVNTVRREGDRFIGENTDGKGFLRSVREDAGIDPRGKFVVFLGAGGAARAMSVELALAGAANITIVNRSPERGAELAKLLSEKTQARAQYAPWMDAYRVPEGTDILVNATSIGLYPNVDDTPAIDIATVRRNLLVCDVIPNPPDTLFLKNAEVRGARTLNGLGMLVYQGAVAFKLWTGVEPDVPVMKDALQRFFATAA